MVSLPRGISSLATFRISICLLFTSLAALSMIGLYWSQRDFGKTASQATEENKLTHLAQMCSQCDHEQMPLRLVTSYWVHPDGKFEIPHRAEVEAAIATNLGNTHLNLIRIILDGSTESWNCSHLQQKIFLLHARLQTLSRAKFDCIDRAEAQPSYFEMFRYTQAEDLRDGIAILSNADIVFDDTVQLLRNLSTGVLLTVATRGISSNTPTAIRKGFELLTGLEASTSAENLCERRRRNSWDSWVFHPDDISVSKKAFLDIERGSPFFMNEVAAENSALHAIISNSKKVVNYFQICDHVHTWHFHVTSKTHKVGSLAVRHKRLKADRCFPIQNCLVTGKIIKI